MGRLRISIVTILHKIVLKMYLPFFKCPFTPFKDNKKKLKKSVIN